MSDNTLYYTLSTMAQAMAAAFALMAVFVLFRIQSSSSRLADILASLAEQTTMQQKLQELRLLIRSQKYKEAIDKLGHATNLSEVIKTSYEDAVIELKSISYYKNVLRGIVYPSVGIIVISTFGLTFVDTLKTCAFTQTGIIILVTFFAVVLFSMAIVIHKVLSA